MLRLIEPTSGEVGSAARTCSTFRSARLRRRGARCRSCFRIRTRRSTRACASARSSRSRSIIHRLGPARRARRRASRELFRLVGLDPAHLDRVSAPVQRRPAAAHRPGPRARAQPVVRHPRRAGLGARRLRAGAGRQPADGSAAAAAADLSVHRARSTAGASTSAAGSPSCFWGRSSRWARRRSSSRRRSIPYTKALLSAIPVPDPGASAAAHRARSVVDSIAKPRREIAAVWRANSCQLSNEA